LKVWELGSLDLLGGTGNGFLIFFGECRNYASEQSPFEIIISRVESTRRCRAGYKLKGAIGTGHAMGAESLSKAVSLFYCVTLPKKNQHNTILSLSLSLVP
jgi:hypothetical protein